MAGDSSVVRYDMTGNLRRGIGRAGYSPRTLAEEASDHTTDAPPTRTLHTHTQGEPMSIETAIGLETGQPYPYRRVELVEPDWTRFPGWKDVTAEEWASVQWQRAHCVKNVRQLRELLGDLVDERFYADLERDQAERATMSMLVPPQMMNTMAPHEEPAGPGLADRRVLRRPDPALHDPGVLRPSYRLVLAPARHPRLAARARHVGGRGAHPPLPDQGARRAAADLPAVLRPLHPDGPGRQLDRRSSTS